MEKYVTMFVPENAFHVREGLDVMNVVPEDFVTDYAFDYAVYKAGVAIPSEHNDVQKTHIILKGNGSFNIDGDTYDAAPGKVFWCKKDSVIVVRAGTEDLHLLCVKKP